MGNSQPKKRVKINPSKIEEALRNVHVVGAAHLDLEGIAYIKLTRTGAQECFASDVTGQILKGEEPAGGKMTYADMQKVFWSRPAMEKWA